MRRAIPNPARRSNLETRRQNYWLRPQPRTDICGCDSRPSRRGERWHKGTSNLVLSRARAIEYMSGGELKRLQTVPGHPQFLSIPAHAEDQKGKQMPGFTIGPDQTGERVVLARHRAGAMEIVYGPRMRVIRIPYSAIKQVVWEPEPFLAEPHKHVRFLDNSSPHLRPGIGLVMSLLPWDLEQVLNDIGEPAFVPSASDEEHNRFPKETLKGLNYAWYDHKAPNTVPFELTNTADNFEARLGSRIPAGGDLNHFLAHETLTASSWYAGVSESINYHEALSALTSVPADLDSDPLPTRLTYFTQIWPFMAQKQKVYTELKGHLFQHGVGLAI